MKENPKPYNLLTYINGEPFEPTELQKKILESNKKETFALISRRRSGVTTALVYSALVKALSKEDSRIVIFCPLHVMVDEIFMLMDKILSKNPQVKKASSGNHKHPSQKRTLENGSTIQGCSLHSNSYCARGLTADHVLIDQVKELTDKDWAIIRPILYGDFSKKEPVTLLGVHTENPFCVVHKTELDPDHTQVIIE